MDVVYRTVVPSLSDFSIMPLMIFALSQLSTIMINHLVDSFFLFILRISSNRSIHPSIQPSSFIRLFFCSHIWIYRLSYMYYIVNCWVGQYVHLSVDFFFLSIFKPYRTSSVINGSKSSVDEGAEKLNAIKLVAKKNS